MIWAVLPRLAPLLSTRLLWEIERVDRALIRITNWNYYIMRRGPCQEGSHIGAQIPRATQADRAEQEQGQQRSLLVQALEETAREHHLGRLRRPKPHIE